MAEKGIPDFMREFDMNIDYGFTPVSSKPVEQKPGVDKQALDSKFEGTNLELSKVKSDVSTIKSMMNEVMQIAAEKDSVNKPASDEKIDYMEKAKELLGKAIPMWIRYAELNPEQAWMVIHLLKDGLFALDRYSEIENILKQILKNDSDNIEVIASLSEIYSHRGENTEAIELIDSALEQDPTSLIVKLIKMKLQAKKERSSNEFTRSLDDTIHFLVTDERFQIYKNTATDPDILWLYETSNEKEKLKP